MKRLARGVILAALLLSSITWAQQQSVTAKFDLTVGHWVELAWTASLTPGVSGYHLYRSKTAGGPYSLANGAIIKGLGFNDYSVLAGETWHYIIRAVASDGVTESDSSNEASATLPSP